MAVSPTKSTSPTPSPVAAPSGAPLAIASGAASVQQQRIQPLTRNDVLFHQLDGVNNIFSAICTCVQDAFYCLLECFCCCFIPEMPPTDTIIVKGSLLDQQVEAIVNAANERCLGGGGIDGLIHDAAGDDLWEECMALPVQQTRVIIPSKRAKSEKPRKVEIRCPIGSAVITGSHDLGKDGTKIITIGSRKVTLTTGHIKHIIHTTGPQYDARKPELMKQQLASCYTSSLTIAKVNGIRSIAFPLISAGIYGYPVDEAAQVAVSAIRKFCAKNPGTFDTVKLVIIEDDKYTTAIMATADMAEETQVVADTASA